MKRLMLLVFLMVFAIVATITPTAFYNVTENDSGSNKAIYNLDEANAAIQYYSYGTKFFNELSIEKSIFMKSLSSEKIEYVFYDLNPNGYAVFQIDSFSLVEACFDGISTQLRNSLNNDVYYGGPFVFCSKSSLGFTNLFSNELLTEDEVLECQKIESQALFLFKQSGAEKRYSDSNILHNNTIFEAGSRTAYSVGYDYFSSLTEFGNNVNDTCTVIAESILLGYYDNYVDDSFVDSTYRNGNGTTEAFHQLLNDYVYGVGGAQSGKFIHETQNGINNYLSGRTCCAVLNSEYSTQTAALNCIQTNLANGRPVIASMGLSHGALWNHTCLVYKLEYAPDTTSLTDATFTVHMGLHSSIAYNSYLLSGAWLFETGYINYHAQHPFTYVTLNSSKHIAMCQSCSYSKIEPHHFSHAYGVDTCTRCGYNGILSLSE